MTPTTLPPDWQPTPGDIEYAKSKGFCEAQAHDMAESFKTYFTGHGKGMNTKHVNWSGGNGAYGNWVRSTTPWPPWRVSQAQEEPWSGRPAPEPFTPEQRAAPRRRVYADPGGALRKKLAFLETIAERPPRQKPKIKPLYVPMPAEARRKLVPDEELEDLP